MHTGVIRSVDFVRGLGYVVDSTGSEVVFITKGLEDKINQGTVIAYEIKQTRVGLIATSIEPRSSTAANN